jgi:hypothetical protein
MEIEGTYKEKARVHLSFILDFGILLVDALEHIV